MSHILIVGDDDVADVSAALLAAAAPDRWRVRKVTSGRRPAFEVPDDVYDKFVESGGLDRGDDVDDTGDDGGDDEVADDADVTPPLVSGDPVVPVADEQGGELDGSRGEAPDRNDKTDEWRAYMRPVLGDAVDGMNRTQLIEAYDDKVGA